MAPNRSSSKSLASSAGTVPVQPTGVYRSPRESMRRLGRWVQPFLTALTGQPLADQAPIWLRTPIERFMQAVITFALAIAAGLVLAAVGPWAWMLLPLPWMFVVNAARSFQTNFVHHATHGNFTGSPRWDRILGELASTLAFIQPMSLYGADHKKHHGQLGLEPDPDLQFLVAMGFKPGQTIAWYWKHLLLSMLSPRFHWMYLKARIRSNFFEAPPLRRAAAALWAMSLVLLASSTGWWLAIGQAIFVPLFPLYHISGMLQVLTEHQWVRVGDGVDHPRVVLARLTSGRFSGQPAPETYGLKALPAWAWWWFKMMTVHAFIRLFVVMGDLPNHDWHHRYPAAGAVKSGTTNMIANWANAAYARRDDALRGSPGWPAYTEFWGLKAAINATFQLLASLPADAELGKPLTYREKQDTALGM